LPPVAKMAGQIPAAGKVSAAVSLLQKSFSPFDTSGRTDFVTATC
jgi:hypothetical protein